MEYVCGLPLLYHPEWMKPRYRECRASFEDAEALAAHRVDKHKQKPAQVVDLIGEDRRACLEVALAQHISAEDALGCVDAARWCDGACPFAQTYFAEAALKMLTTMGAQKYWRMPLARINAARRDALYRVRYAAVQRGLRYARCRVG